MTQSESVSGFTWVIAGVSATTLALLTVLDPSASPLLPPCLFRAVTGWLCPGCGSARAIHAIMHGQLNVALSANPLSAAALPLLPMAAYRSIVLSKPPIPATVPAVYLWGALAVVVLFGIGRNIPPW